MAFVSFALVFISGFALADILLKRVWKQSKKILPVFIALLCKHEIL